MHMKLQKPPAYDSDESDDDGWNISCLENWDQDIDRIQPHIHSDFIQQRGSLSRYYNVPVALNDIPPTQS